MPRFQSQRTHSTSGRFQGRLRSAPFGGRRHPGRLYSKENGLSLSRLGLSVSKKLGAPSRETDSPAAARILSAVEGRSRSGLRFVLIPRPPEEYVDSPRSGPRSSNWPGRPSERFSAIPLRFGSPRRDRPAALRRDLPLVRTYQAHSAPFPADVHLPARLQRVHDPGRPKTRPMAGSSQGPVATCAAAIRSTGGDTIRLEQKGKRKRKSSTARRLPLNFALIRSPPGRVRRCGCGCSPPAAG